MTLFFQNSHDGCIEETWNDWLLAAVLDFSGLWVCVCVCVCVRGQTGLMGCVRGGWGVFSWTGDGGRKCRDLWRGWLPLSFLHSGWQAERVRRTKSLLPLSPCTWRWSLRDQSVRHISICLPEKVTLHKDFGFLSLTPDNSTVWWSCSCFEGCGVLISAVLFVGLHHHC